MESYRIQEDASLYFVTFSVVDWLPVFVSEEACSVLADSLAFCQSRKGLRVNAYVFMPTHIHMILFDAEYDPRRLSETMTAFRKYTGRMLSDFAAQHLPEAFTRVFRDAAASGCRDPERMDRARRFWQPSRHPVALTGERMWRQKLDYLHDNPRRKGLLRYPEHWRYSSARYYLEGPDDCGDVEVTEVEW